MGGWVMGEKKTKSMLYSTQLKLNLKLELCLAMLKNLGIRARADRSASQKQLTFRPAYFELD